MAWNEPGGGKDPDPWGNRKKDEGPPDLDELVRKMRERFGGLFGGRSGGGGGRRGGGAAASFSLGLLIAIGLLLWAASGIYIVDEAERGVVTRFGKFADVTAPGLHWHIPYPIERVEKVNVKEVRNVTHKAQMLTRDQNLILIDIAVQYQVSDPKSYLFNVREPDYTLKEATESALREVVGSKSMDEILKPGGREIVVIETQQHIQRILEIYKAGLLVAKVNMQSTQPPDAVQDAFQDAIKAEEDQVRYRNEAESYARDILPKAEGEAERLLEEARAYKLRVTEDARGQTSRFTQTLAEYRKAPQVTRQRLYLDTMQQVLGSVSKVVIKVEQGNSIMYLPLDRFLTGKRYPQATSAQGAAEQLSNSDSSGASSSRFSTSSRQREGR